MKGKNEKNKKKVKTKTGNKILLAVAIAAIVIMAVILASVFTSYYSGKETKKENNKSAEPKPDTIQAPKQESVSVGGIVIDPSMTPLPTPVPTLVSREGPVTLTIESPQKVLAGDEFTANITVNPAGNKIVGIEFNVVFSKLVAESIELSEEADPALSETKTGTGISIVGIPTEVFPSQTFLLASIKFKAVEKGKEEIRLREVGVLNEEGNFVYFVSNTQTIQIS